MRVLVCGGRAYSNWWALTTVLDALNITEGVSVIIHGGANGADRMADNWAYWRQVPVQEYNIVRGREDGFGRNGRMLQHGKPDLLIAFPGGAGTADMVRRAKSKRIVVIEVPE